MRQRRLGEEMYQFVAFVAQSLSSIFIDIKIMKSLHIVALLPYRKELI